MEDHIERARRPCARFLAASAALLLCVQACGGDASSGVAESPEPVPLGPPETVFPQDFGYVHTVRELPGGEALVADPLGRALYRVDMDAGTRIVAGSVGEGPGEYLQPDGVWPFRGDSTLLLDLGRVRLMRMGPALAFGETHPAARFPDSGMPLMVLPEAVDAEGNVYAPDLGGYPPPDSGAILRIGLAEGTVDTVTAYKLRDHRVTETDQGILIDAVRLSPEDAWGVAPDGSVVVARAGEYRVDWFAPDGTVTRGETVAYPALPVTRAEMAEDIRASGRHGGIGIDVGRLPDGGRTVNMWRGGSAEAEEEVDYDNYTWHNVKPALHAMTVRVDPLGRAWVRRQVRVGGGTRYDLFDRDGRLVRALTLDGDRVVAGFGPERVYVVAFDELDLAYLERYRLPGG